MLGDYADSGHRDPKSRLIDSIRSNLRYQLIVLGTAIAVLVYYIWQNGFHLSSIKGTIIASAYAWGLVLAIYLMGHGLVALPRRLFRGASISGRLRQLQSHASGIHDKLTDAIDELDALELQVVQLRQRKTGTAKDFQDWIQELADTSDLPESRAGRTATPHNQDVRIPSVITERYLADLTRKLKRARHKRIRFVEEWDHLVGEATDLQCILDAAGSQKLEFGRDRYPAWMSRWTLMTPYTRYLVHAKLLPVLRYGLSGFLALASVCVVWSEIFKQAIPKISVVGLSIVHHPNATDKGKIGFAGQAIAAAWLCYMCAAALLSIREVKVWGNRALVRRHTYAESATWYSLQVAKLTVPLSYNFITFLPRSIFEATTFHRFLGHYIDFTPLGEAFSAFFPIFILVPVCAAAFGLYGRIKRVAGFGMLDDDEDSAFGTGGWREGKALIDRERMEGGARRSVPAGESAVGLLSRQAPSRDAPYRDETSPASPYASQGASSLPASSAPGTRATGAGTGTASRAAADDNEGEGNFFEDFAHRVKNTFDTRTPFKLNFERPKWLGGGQEPSSGGDEQGPLDRLFGGARNGGPLRL